MGCDIEVEVWEIAYFFAFNAARALFSVTRNFTIFFIRVTGKGSSMGKRMAPFDVSKPASSFVKFFMPEAVG